MSDETTTDGPTAATSDAAETESAAEAHRRRTIIRLLVGLGIGIPILVELATFVGLVEQSLLGDDRNDGGGGESGDTTTTAGSGGVGVGDELLPDTPQRETLSVASFRAATDQWVLTLAASVENTASEPYTVQFGPVTTERGRTVEGTGRAVTVAAGDTAQITGTWQLPPGDRPASVVVRTGAGDAVTTDHTVDLGRIPVEGS
ncbi:hypothetical protein [Salinigranum salinum]|uniref:hypothetical protein n=1 Tax=Salinigranum salinum TaxID=1364937 RepID=UPI001260C13F|nr:hypothetical protein [Salinigranum salinum]